MKDYAYFPGCSAESTGLGLGLSVRAVAAPLEISLLELEDWTCCGSTPYGSLDEAEAVLVAARNLALAEKTGLDLVTPCSSCYVTLRKADGHLRENVLLRRQVNEALQAIGLQYRGTVRVRQLMEVLVNDVTPEFIAGRVQRPLEGMAVAPYYGCQMVRPDYGFDHPENPQTLERILTALGAKTVDFPLKARCCGGSHTISAEGAVLGLLQKLLKNAADSGAQCLATPCPLCQTNLDAFQGRVNAVGGTDYHMPVFYVTQLIGLALGLSPDSLGIKSNIVSPAPLLKQLAGVKSGA
ncbi:MAG: CoB--CoM heterodisulfide reductase iron-sulfur subunit B family protein [Chloroflexota bacterium]